jgi:protein TonB
MFDLVVAGRGRHPFHKPTMAPTIISIVAHVSVIAAIITASILLTSNVMPEVPVMMAFVAAPPAPPPPPPPPPPVRKAAPTPVKPEPVNRVSASAAPIVAPASITAESFIPGEDDEEGVLGGVEGGISGGVPGGVIGGLVMPPAPPPPPPAPVAAPRAPVRIGGQLTAPALLHRVNPEYPEVAVLAKVTGMVILEATVAANGSVESVRVLRSVPLLDRAAIAAVKQWRYSPLVLNGVASPFVLTVTLNFSMPPGKR